MWFGLIINVIKINILLTKIGHDIFFFFYKPLRVVVMLKTEEDKAEFSKKKKSNGRVVKKLLGTQKPAISVKW